MLEEYIIVMYVNNERERERERPRGRQTDMWIDSSCL